jgi:hypothetical protein
MNLSLYKHCVHRRVATNKKVLCDRHLAVVVDELDGFPALDVVIGSDAGSLGVGTSGLFRLPFPAAVVGVVALVGVLPLVVVVDGSAAIFPPFVAVSF